MCGVINPLQRYLFQAKKGGLFFLFNENRVSFQKSLKN